jgi:cell division protein FtsW
MAVMRSDTSTLGRWWWTIDRWTLGALLMLIGFGFLMMLAASPAVAERVIGTESRSLLLVKQIAFLVAATGVLFAASLLSPRQVLYAALICGVGAVLLTVATLSIGVETKGARRWLAIPMLGTLQPSEFLKPCFSVVIAWLLAEGKGASNRSFTVAGHTSPLLRGDLLFPLSAFMIFAIIAVILKSQPDFGMLMVVASTFLAQLFVAGLSMFIVILAGAVGASLAVGAYFVLPHVRSRVDRFLDPSSGDTFQITKALEAFGNGGLFGRGPGEGRIKNTLPDAHADFVFAVAGEEFGLVVCLIVVLLFMFVVVRGMIRMLADEDMFAILAAAGLLSQFGLQAFVNMASSLHLIPTKGMTLPFVSYGGSSVLAIAFGMGMLLAITRKRAPGSGIHRRVL